MRRPAVPVWLRLVRVFQKIDQASAAHLRRWDLSVAQFDVLAHVGAAEGMSQQQLAKSLLVTKSDVCQILNRMEKSGLLVRRHEGRTNQLYLTDAGRRLFDEVIPAQEALIEAHLSPLTREEQVRLHELLRKLDRALS